ncbi:MAG: hypothetical protein COZ66_01445 [Candidatus Huberarchaeum crystalense]|uniref:Uncharacterized protein n=1 Tax=Huberarchaeum crystalense TaxID=2014257 RepID=A0A2H9N2M4_HUBC1|nr:MAG: hypothetical protein COZ66_01445 [Candidatus Huberarchaeum crystalense]
MILREIVLGQTEDSKREAVQKNLGQQVILNDDHEEWCHGVLLTERYDNEVYQMKVADGRGQRQLHYHDLNQLLVIANYPEYRRPEID